jgi:hypothetical protein
MRWVSWSANYSKKRCARRREIGRPQRVDWGWSGGSSHGVSNRGSLAKYQLKSDARRP